MRTSCQNPQMKPGIVVTWKGMRASEKKTEDPRLPCAKGTRGKSPMPLIPWSLELRAPTGFGERDGQRMACGDRDSGRAKRGAGGGTEGMEAGGARREGA